MAGSLAWLAIIAAGVGWDMICRWSRTDRPGIGRIGSSLAIWPVGRIGLLVVWAFVGVHLFARYTLPAGW